MRLVSACLRLLLLFAVATSGCSRDEASHLAGLNGAPKENLLTKYPVVLLHGFFGWRQVFHVDYFYQVPEYLKGLGYQIETTHVTPINTIAVRAQQLAPQIDEILARTGAAKVNLIAHSQGGLDARYLISVMGYGDRVASLTTIATPHQGSPIADAVLGLVHADAQVTAAAKAILHGTTALIANDPGHAHFGDIDLGGALHDLSTNYVSQTFAKEAPDDDRVYYQSWSGQATFRHKFQPDIFDPIVSVVHRFIANSQGENDGLVSRASALHGVDRGVVPGDHLDEIGQLLGREPEGFDHKVYYRQIVEDLAAHGF